MHKSLKILFVSSGNKKVGVSPIVRNQGRSLISQSIILDHYAIDGKGFLGYAKNIALLARVVKKGKYNLIHAHYSLSGFVAGVACLFNNNTIVSLMGSDIEKQKISRIFIRLFNFFSWSAVIVKSKRLKDKIGIKNAHILPNGVNLEIFKPEDYKKAREKIGFEVSKNYVLFLANPNRPEKNFTLAKAAIEICKKDFDVELIVLHEIPHKQIPDYLSATDVLLLTSHFEGSPNVIKEAMACNCPIVSTDVGDVKEVMGDTDGCYISSFDPENVAQKLKMALEFGKRTNGRENIQHLDDKVIAKRLIDIYKSVLSPNV